MRFTPPFLEQFFKCQRPIIVERIEAEMEVDWLLVFFSSWIFEPFPIDRAKEWNFGQSLRIVDMTLGKWDVSQELVTEFSCPGDTPSFQLPDYDIRFDTRVPVRMPKFAGKQLCQAMRDFGFESTTRYRGMEGHGVSHSSLRVTNDWTAHEKIQLRTHVLVENFRQIGFDVDEPLRNLLKRSQ